jgi:predicted lipoprotein with Yx(FWY)xxD motif
MSPYPPGIRLPELDERKSCTDLWKPVTADEGAQEVGDWTVVERRDGARQWAYQEQPLYTSVKDQEPGDVLGGTRRRFGGDAPAKRVPVGPPSLHPPGFSIRSSFNGRMLATDRSESVYSYEGDTADSSSCRADCLAKWKPVLAPSLARAQGEWSLLERSPGERQWVFRGKPLYTYILDSGTWSQQGSDEPGWENVFTQVADSYPDSFRPQHTMVGDVLADSEGKTIYIYHCGEDSQDQLGCDHPTETQVYRLAMCGAGDPERCLEYWPYVLAGDHEQATNRTWSIVWIDPRTGRFAAPQQEGALRVWAYRDRPVYTFAGDSSPGDVHGGGTGEWRGQRNGLKAIMLRDDFFRGTL